MFRSIFKGFVYATIVLFVATVMLVGCVYNDEEIVEKREVNQEQMVKELEAKDEAKAEKKAEAKEQKKAEADLKATREKEQADAIAEMNASRVSLEEFTQITDGMTKDQVTSIIGGPIELLSSSGNAEIYMAEGVGSLGANANFTFIDGTLYGKAQFGLE